MKKVGTMFAGLLIGGLIVSGVAGCSLFTKKVPTCALALEAQVVNGPKMNEVSVVLAPTASFVDFEKLLEASNPAIQAALGEAGSRLNIVLADGAPGLTTSFDVDGSRFSVDLKSDQVKGLHAAASVLACVLGTDKVSDTIPVDSEVDLLDSLRVAADSFDVKNEASVRKIFVLGNGLQTNGQYKMQSDGIPPMSAVNSVVSNLKNGGALPDLKGATVEFIGLGHVSAKSERLNQQSIEGLEAFWTAIVEASNGHIGAIQREVGDTTPSGNSIVTTPVKALPEACISAVVTEDDGARFTPGQADFVDPAAATASAKKIADQLAKKADCKGALTVTGYVASATDKAQYQFGNPADANLSMARAKAFAALLEAAGVKSPITSIGGGKGPFSDWDGTGKYVETLGAKNRIVSVTQ